MLAKATHNPVIRFWRSLPSIMPKKKKQISYWGMTRFIEHMIDSSTMLDKIKAQIADHPAEEDCPDPECHVCGARKCPYGEPMHYHKDGCPACYWYVYTPEQRKMDDVVIVEKPGEETK